MTVSYKKSKGGEGAGQYYVDCMKSGDGSADGAKSVDDYYTGSGKEPPGKWYSGPSATGERTSALGFTNGLSFNPELIDTERFMNLVKGYHPETGEALTQNAGSPDRVALHDWTLSAPKSVSVAWALGDEKTKEALESSQESNSRLFLDFMSSHSMTRRGKDGVQKVHAPLLGATFGHGSSRADDPQLHTHCTVFNIALADGRTTALETTEMMKWTGAAASLYHAGLAWDARQLGFEIERVENLFELSGVPKTVCEHFSKRREAIVAAVNEELIARGLDPDSTVASRGLFQKATTETRDGKSELTREQLQQLWTDQGLALGFSVAQVNELMQAGPAKELTEDSLLEIARSAVREITENHATFKEPALLTKVATSMIGLASPAQIQATVESIKSKDLLTTLSMDERTGREEKIFTTREMLVLERQMLALADRKDGQHVLTDVSFPDTLKPEQLVAAMHATKDVNSVSVVEGTAGAGKTFTMAAISRTYEANGYQVIGLSGSWNAALNLKNEAKLSDGRAITGWINEIKRGELSLTDKTCIVVDEAGMVGSSQIKDVLEVASNAGAKVILLGDTLQQKAIASGDPLRVIVKQNQSARLDQIVRQKNVADREAVASFFAGNAKEGLATFIDRGEVHILDSDVATNTRIVEDWHSSRKTNGGEHLMIASDKKSVRAINLLAHDARKAAGELGASQSFKTMDGTKEHPEVEFSVGDEVVVRVTQKDKDIFNRTRGTLESFDGQVVNIRTKDGVISIDSAQDQWQYKEDGKAKGFGLQHAYCTTTFASQGLTVDHALIKDSLALNRASAGVAMSRHRETAAVYIDREARYQSKMNTVAAEDWHPKSQFSDAECLGRIGTAWSAEAKKSSTLDFENWQRAGAAVDVQTEVRIQNLADEKSRILANREIDRIREASKVTDIRPRELLPFQSEANYVLPEPKAPLPVVQSSLDKILGDGISEDVIREANRQGFMRIDDTGRDVYMGRREDGQVVNHAIDGEKQAALRDRFPPILRGQSDEVHLAQHGRDALHIWTHADRSGLERPTVIVASTPESLSLPHTRNHIESKASVIDMRPSKTPESYVTKTASAEPSKKSATEHKGSEMADIRRENKAHSEAQVVEVQEQRQEPQRQIPQ